MAMLRRGQTTLQALSRRPSTCIAVCVCLLLSRFLACEDGTPSASPAAPPLPAGASPVAFCETASMVSAYPGDFPNQPNDPQPLASACIAAAHDVIIVLGCPNEDTGAPSACQMARADIAVSLAAAGYGQFFITTGGAVHNGWVEADTLRDLLIMRGIAADQIETEPLAEHTDENIYFSTRIMEQRDFVSAVVVSDQPGHLTLTAVCDSNCCVNLGRLTVVDFPVKNGRVTAGHYVRFPWAPAISAEECTHIETPTKFMCTNLDTRRACKSHFML